jgi:hypothetical protein
MAELRMFVDHLKLDYKGLFDAKSLITFVESWLKERGFHKRTYKDFEHMVDGERHIEWEIASWKKVSDYAMHIIKIRALFLGLKKTEAMHDKEKLKLNQGRLLIYFDGYIEYDYEHRWDEKPMLLFFRMLYDKYIHRVYTQQFEKELVKEVTELFHETQKFLNLYTHFKPIEKVPYF